MAGHISSVTGLPVLAEVAGHHRPVPFWLTRDMFGGLPVELAGAEISGMVGAPVADTHTHDVPEIYFLIAPETGGAEILIEIDDTETVVAAPAVVYVPAGSRHRFVTRAAMPGSYCFGVLLHDRNGTKEARRS